MTTPQSISIAYTPDSDDAFYYYALQTGKVSSEEFTYSFSSDHIIALNRAARAGQFDVTAVSAVAYPALAEEYCVLSVGSSVGRGYGPVLVGKQACSLDDLSGKRVGVAGLATTGGMLMKWAQADVEVVEMQFDKIADAVAADKLDAGVMIHEELLFFHQKGLSKIADLGAHWTEKTGLPLPVGLNLIRRSLGIQAGNRLCDQIRQSLLYALENQEEALAWACQFGRGAEGDCGKEHIEMFANADSVFLPQDVREALAHMMQITFDMGISDSVPSLDFVDGATDVSEQLATLLTA